MSHNRENSKHCQGTHLCHLLTQNVAVTSPKWNWNIVARYKDVLWSRILLYPQRKAPVCTKIVSISHFSCSYCSLCLGTSFLALCLECIHSTSRPNSSFPCQGGLLWLHHKFPFFNRSTTPSLGFLIILFSQNRSASLGTKPSVLFSQNLWVCPAVSREVVRFASFTSCVQTLHRVD